MTPRISLLLPTYEPNPTHLREAITSVLAQTEKEWTLLIHDDASQTDVLALVEPFLTDPRITCARNPERLGIGGNWNACLQRTHTSAPYIQFLFQDDTWSPDYLATMASILDAHPSVGFASAAHNYTMEGNVPLQHTYQAITAQRASLLSPGEHDGKEFLYWWMDRGLHPNLIGEPSFVMLRRTLTWRAGLFLEDMPQSLDAEYWTRCLQHADWYWEPRILGAFRVHAAGASAMNQQEGRGLFDRLRCMERVMDALPTHEGKHAAARALEQQLSGMIQKFLARRKGGQSTQLSGSGAVKRLLLRHPLLAMRAGLHALHADKN